MSAATGQRLDGRWRRSPCVRGILERGLDLVVPEEPPPPVAARGLLAYRRDNRIRYVNPNAFSEPPREDEEVMTKSFTRSQA
jgi:hypothetical protein